MCLLLNGTSSDGYGLFNQYLTYLSTMHRKRKYNKTPTCYEPAPLPAQSKPGAW
jgi:hypothetical protein